MGTLMAQALAKWLARVPFLRTLHTALSDTTSPIVLSVVERRKKKKPPCRNQCGTALTGPNMLLRPAIQTTLLYVSRLHHSTKAEEIVEYLRIKTKWTLRVERLEPRHNMNFNSFVVRVPTSDLEKFLKEDLWPKGVVFRRFRGRLRDTSQRNTTPMIRVQ
ncbi:hypothetical protein B5X24_HaOG208790 [Helicoverpa armigera]|uniref:Uncharacterized protein n=1 Tax=Helicoverpa armigera TaxID=29058 RepID=A0A2W1BF98_HELAM|nr:hypothetical protein B5X24_HaOG208790 [Helicoverpa armigera]